MANQIVYEIVSITNPPAPNLLQQTGVLISQGGTNTAQNTRTLITQPSDLTPILQGARAITSMTWSGSVVTVTTTAPHGYPNGDALSVTIAGVTPAAYNGTVTATVTGASTFTYPLASNPGAVTIQGVYSDADIAQLLAMVTTFFAQGANTSVYVLELGPGTAAQGVATLSTYMTNNPLQNYIYLTPYGWDAEPTFATYAGLFNAPTAKQYFEVTATTETYTNFTALQKCVSLTIQAPGAPATEFTAAALLYAKISQNPSSTNKVPPLSFRFVYGVTPYPTAGNSALFATLKAAGVNIIGTGAEGGLSTAIIFWGTQMDGNPWGYWYSVDWFQINEDLDLANETINGSNSPLNPLYYNQAGIDRLQNVAIQTASTGIGYGLALGNVIKTKLPIAQFITNLNNGAYAGNLVINAEPFADYTAENPSDYAIGRYAGLAMVVTPARGFAAIYLNINVTNFA